jgi:hypothetical protein
MPLIVIIQESPGNAGFSEGGILNVLKYAEVFKEGGTHDSGEKKAQVESLSRSGVGIVHSANLMCLLPDSPLASLRVPDHLGAEVLIEDVTHVRIKYIGLEPSSECGVPVLIALQSLLASRMSVRIYNNQVLPWKVDLEAQNTELMLLHLKEVKPPAGLTAGDISGIQVLLDLILTGAKLHGGAVVALVHILGDVLDCFD